MNLFKRARTVSMTPKKCVCLALDVVVCAWVRTRRAQLFFIALLVSSPASFWTIMN